MSIFEHPNLRDLAPIEEYPDIHLEYRERIEFISIFITYKLCSIVFIREYPLILLNIFIIYLANKYPRALKFLSFLDIGVNVYECLFINEYDNICILIIFYILLIMKLVQTLKPKDFADEYYLTDSNFNIIYMVCTIALILQQIYLKDYHQLIIDILILYGIVQFYNSKFRLLFLGNIDFILKLASFIFIGYKPYYICIYALFAFMLLIENIIYQSLPALPLYRRIWEAEELIITNIKKYDIINKKEETCSICLGDLPEKCASLICGHLYCPECINAWTNIKPNCPLCKASIFP